MDKDKGVVSFGADPEYLAKIQAAKKRIESKVNVSIPRLDQPPSGPQPSITAGKKVLTPEQQEQLKNSGQLIPGVGSAYRDNQPPVPNEQASAEFTNPPRPPGAGLRPETVQQLQGVAQANAKATQDEEEVKKATSEIDDIENQYDTDDFGRRVLNILRNKNRRDAIESRCQPMEIDDLISHGEVRQRVPVVPGKYEPTFRSVAGNEDLFIKRLMGKERGSETYMLDQFALMNLTAGLYAFNGKVLPAYLDEKGEPVEELFREKMRIVAKYGFPILSDLSANFTWFARRVDRLLTIDNIKGF